MHQQTSKQPTTHQTMSNILTHTYTHTNLTLNTHTLQLTHQHNPIWPGPSHWQRCLCVDYSHLSRFARCFVVFQACCCLCCCGADCLESHVWFDKNINMSLLNWVKTDENIWIKWNLDKRDKKNLTNNRTYWKYLLTNWNNKIKWNEIKTIHNSQLLPVNNT